jgi:serine protease
MAQYLQAFYSGLGTDGELWSATVTQYCQGIAAGAVTCPLSAEHVAYPTGGVLAGVWEDTSFTPPTGPPGSGSTPGVTGLQIQQEAANAAVFFGDSSIDAQYVIVSPTGTNPDGWASPRTGYCAYHSFTGDTFSGTVTGPNVPYTNLPYIPDAEASNRFSCTEGLVAYPAGLDGVTEISGHEYYETLTDPFQRSGWSDRKGLEVADKCDYLNPGQPGTEISLTLATGSFPVQGMWANDANKGKGGCEDSHSPILMTTPAKQHMAEGPASLAIGALDVLPAETLSYSAAGLPAGLSINPASGLISGTATTRGHSVVTVTASDGSHSASVSFKWVITR